MRSGFDAPLAEARTAAAFAEERPAPDLGSLFVRGVRRSWVWVGVLAATGAAAGLVVGLLQPNVYASSAKLFLRAGAREQVTSESLAGVEGDRRASLPTLVDELQMLSDGAIFERVAQKIGPRSILEPADPSRDDGPETSALVRLLHRVQAACLAWTSSPHACTTEDCPVCLRLAGRALVESTPVGNEPGSSVILVRTEATSPERAHAIVRALSEAFIERHRTQFSIQSLVEPNRRKVEAARATRDAAAGACVEDASAGSLEDAGPSATAILAEITGLEAELFGARVRQKAIVRQRAALSGRLADLPVEVALPGPVVLVPNEEWETQLMLKRSLLAQKQSLPLEGRTFEDMRRRAAVLEEQIEAADLALARLPKAVARDPAMRENLGHTALSTRVEDLDLEDQALVVQIESSQQRLAEQRAHLVSVRKELSIATLRRRDLDAARDAAELAYKDLAARFSVLEALGSIEAHEDPNLRVLQAATLEPEKTGPRRLALLMKGLCAGLVAGIAFAMLRQALSSVLSHPDAFERTHGVPVLGVVPEVAALRRPSGIAVVT